MTMRKMRPAPLAKVAGPGILLSSADRSSGYPTIPVSFQDRIDPVAWIAARANVATSTARVHAELFGIGGVQ